MINIKIYVYNAKTNRPLSVVGLRRKRCPVTLTVTAWVQFLPSPTHETCLYCSSKSVSAYGVEICFSPSASKKFYSVHPH